MERMTIDLQTMMRMTMKTTKTLLSVAKTTTLLSLLALVGSAEAATPFSGQYGLGYDHLAVAIQCGELVNGAVQIQYSTQLSAALDESLTLPEDFTAAAETSWSIWVTTQSLTPRQEAAAQQALSLYFEGLERTIEASLQTLPETLTILPQTEGETRVSYNFMAQLQDERMSSPAQTSGTMGKRSGNFSLVPVAVGKLVENSQVLSSVSTGLTLNGSVPRQEATLRWTSQVVMNNPINGLTLGCVMSNAVEAGLVLE